MFYEMMVAAARAMVESMSVEELVSSFENICKSDLSQPTNQAAYSACRGELLGRMKGV